MNKRVFNFLFICVGFCVIACNSKNTKPQQVAVNKSDSINSSLQSINAKIAASPNNAALYFERAYYYFNKKNMEQAFADAQKTIQLDSTKAEYYIFLSDIYFITVQTGKTKQLLEKAIEIDPNNVGSMLKLAELYLYVKENKKSIAELDKALKVNKYNAKAYFIKGMNFKEMGDTSRAISSFQTTVEQDPEYYNAYIQLGNLNALKNNPATIDYYNSALNIDAKSIEALYGKAMFYQQNGNFDKAKEMYNTILQINSKNKSAHYNLGYIDFEFYKNYNNALIHFSDAINADAEYYQAYYMRGLCFENLKMLKKAELEYLAALQLKSDYKKAQEGIERIKSAKH